MNIVDKSFIYLKENCDTRQALIRKIGEDLKKANRIKNIEAFLKDILTREEDISTYMGDGIAIPHCKADNVLNSTVVLLRNEKKVIWNSDDEPTDLVFLLSIKNTNQNEDQSHLKVLSRLAQNLMNENFMDIIRHESDIDSIYQALKKIEGGEAS